MNQLATMEPAAETAIFDPQAFAHMGQVAAMLVDSGMLPAHLKGKLEKGKLVQLHTRDKQIAIAFVVVNAARRLGADVFAFAQSSFLVHGKLDFDGKVYAALANASGKLASSLSYEYMGDGGKKVCICSARFKGESEPRTLQTPSFAECAKQGGTAWDGCNPEQQLSYYAARSWVRRHCPEVLLGLASDSGEYEEPPYEAPTQPRDEVVHIPFMEKPANIALHMEAIKAATTIDELKTARAQIDADQSLTRNDLCDIAEVGRAAMERIKASTTEQDPSAPEPWEITLNDCEAVICESNDRAAMESAFELVEKCDGMPVAEVKRLGGVMNERLRTL